MNNMVGLFSFMIDLQALYLLNLLYEKKT